MTAAPLLQLDAVSVHYGSGAKAVTALAGIDLRVERGEMVAVMGTSGSGKSTLLACAGTLLPPTSGEVLIDGAFVSDRPAKELAALRRRLIGFVFQDFNLIPSLTAVENVALPLELDGWKASQARRAAELALDNVELSLRSDAYAADLSGGQQQRVAIARGVVGERRLVLESMVFQAEAEVRWLDHVESSVARYRLDEHPAAPASADASAAAAASAPRSAR